MREEKEKENREEVLGASELLDDPVTLTKQELVKVQKSIQELQTIIGQLGNNMIKAMHRIQLLQMDGEVEVKDLGLIVKDLKGDRDAK